MTATITRLTARVTNGSDVLAYAAEAQVADDRDPLGNRLRRGGMELPLEDDADALRDSLTTLAIEFSDGVKGDFIASRVTRTDAGLWITFEGPVEALTGKVASGN